MKKIIYLAGCGRSGSTLLDLILGQHSKVVALGEIVNLLGDGIEYTRKKGVSCSCGNTIDDCEFWGSVSSKFNSNGKLSKSEQYDTILETAQSVFGEDVFVVDQSKSLEPLREILKNPDIDVRVIHLLKDVRPFAISQYDRARRRLDKGLMLNRNSKSKLMDYFRRFPIFFYLDWYRRNKRIKEFLERKSLPVFQLGYEELCLYTDQIVPQICEFADIELEPAMFSIENPHNHVIRGNQMRSDPKKRKIRYDNRWFYRAEWMLPSVLFPHIMKFNRREVYRNTAGTIWDKK